MRCFFLLPDDYRLRQKIEQCSLYLCEPETRRLIIPLKKCRSSLSKKVRPRNRIVNQLLLFHGMAHGFPIYHDINRF